MMSEDVDAYDDLVEDFSDCDQDDISKLINESYSV